MQYKEAVKYIRWKFVRSLHLYMFFLLWPHLANMRNQIHTFLKQGIWEHAAKYISTCSLIQKQFTFLQ